LKDWWFLQVELDLSSTNQYERFWKNRKKKDVFVFSKKNQQQKHLPFVSCESFEGESGEEELKNLTTRNAEKNTIKRSPTITPKQQIHIAFPYLRKDQYLGLFLGVCSDRTRKWNK
jgi:hypothetical protein